MLIALCSLALAADLKVNVTVPDRAPMEVVLKGSSPGPLFNFAVPGLADRVALEVTSEADGAHALTVVVAEVRKGWFGRVRQREIWRSVMPLEPGKVATSSMANRAPIPGTDPVAFRDVGFDIEAWIVDATPERTPGQ